MKFDKLVKNILNEAMSSRSRGRYAGHAWKQSKNTYVPPSLSPQDVEQGLQMIASRSGENNDRDINIPHEVKVIDGRTAIVVDGLPKYDLLNLQDYLKRYKLKGWSTKSLSHTRPHVGPRDPNWGVDPKYIK